MDDCGHIRVCRGRDASERSVTLVIALALFAGDRGEYKIRPYGLTRSREQYPA